MSLENTTIRDDVTAAKWFGVGVRLLGVWECLNGFDELVTYCNAAMRLYTPSLTSPNAYLAHAVEHLLAGLFLLLSAANVVAVSYTAEGEAKEQSEVT
jgi:hypothetical protein